MFARAIAEQKAKVKKKMEEELRKAKEKLDAANKPLKKKFELVEVLKQKNMWDPEANPQVVLKLEEKV